LYSSRHGDETDRVESLSLLYQVKKVDTKHLYINFCDDECEVHHEEKMYEKGRDILWLLQQLKSKKYTLSGCSQFGISNEPHGVL
jgi:hypothetical protein